MIDQYDQRDILERTCALDFKSFYILVAVLLLHYDITFVQEQPGDVDTGGQQPTRVIAQVEDEVSGATSL